MLLLAVFMYVVYMYIFLSLPYVEVGKVGRISSEEVVLQLVKSKCLPILLYCLEVCPLTKTDLKLLDFLINRFFMKLFRTSNIDTVKTCRLQFSFDLV